MLDPRTAYIAPRSVFIVVSIWDATEVKLLDVVAAEMLFPFEVHWYIGNINVDFDLSRVPHSFWHISEVNPSLI